MDYPEYPESDVASRTNAAGFGIGEVGVVVQDSGVSREDAESSVGADDGDKRAVDFDDPRIANLPRIVLMGPRRAGKSKFGFFSYTPSTYS